MIRLLKKIAALPLALVLSFFWIAAQVAYKISGTVLVIILLLSGVGLAYYILIQEWHNVLFLGCVEIAGIVLLISSAFIICISEELRNNLFGFIFS